MRYLPFLLHAAFMTPISSFAAHCDRMELSGIETTVCTVDTRRDRLQVFLRDESGTPFKFFSALQRHLNRRQQELVVAMNAGMYHESYEPVGLLVVDGREVAPLNLQTAPGNFFLKPNGVFAITAAGPRIIKSSRYSTLTDVELATQSGPMLVMDGALHPSFRKDSTSKYVRNGVGLLDEHRVLFVISEQPVTFYEFATLFRDGLGCKDALYLDGGVSSLYSRASKRSDVRAALGPILAVVDERLDQ
ncbi:MAG TPA: phosphodiester glycosidase family protein [Steroidobacteraceae bacterium]|nr:phosphodiester glycosidase family protein [Steroidobacteraceae bacterium]